MEGPKNGIGWWAAVALLTCAVMLMMPTEVAAKRYIVGDNMGWTSNVNYTIWARDKHFYLGDWLFFVYDRNQMNVLEVNGTDYDKCTSDHPLHNWTTGAGRDVVPLNVTKNRYFVSSNGFCFGGMKLAIHVEKLPPPPKSAPLTSHSPSFPTSFTSHIFVPLLFAVAKLWDSFVLFV